MELLAIGSNSSSQSQVELLFSILHSVETLLMLKHLPSPSKPMALITYRLRFVFLAHSHIKFKILVKLMFWDDPYILQAVNFGNIPVNLKVSMTGLDSRITRVSGYKKKVLTSTNVMDENSFSNPEMVKHMKNQSHNDIFLF